MAIPIRSFRHDVRISALGYGGHLLGDAQDQTTATRLVREAVDGGITFFDNGWEYHRGKSEEWMGAGLKGVRDRVFLMTKVCTHGRDKSVAMRMPEQSFHRPGTDHLDVWQIHEVIYDDDSDLIFLPSGAAEALVQAKQDGKVRFVGFTGHKDPAIHLRMPSYDFPSDTVQMPLSASIPPSAPSSNTSLPSSTAAVSPRSA
jgi:aryl-alcohol dehydrogenase-like predicted oxidoreductase